MMFSIAIGSPRDPEGDGDDRTAPGPPLLDLPASGRFKNAGTQVGMTTRGAWIRDATETDALECGAAHHAIAFEPRVDRETPRVGGGRHGAFVCVPCARESRGAWTGRTRQRQWTGRAPARVSFEFSSVVRSRTRNDCRHFLPDSRAPHPSSSRVFEFAASHVSLQSVALSCIVWSSRVARRASPARVSRPCHARSPGPAIARGRGFRA